MQPRDRSASGRFAAGDVVAGISVALILIPQSLAYAELAGMPPYHGLYAATFPLIAAAFFVSSPYLQTGPGAMTALLTLGALTAIAVPRSDSYVALAALLALVVGLTRVVLGAVRAGWVAYLMSQPVVTGFTTGAALLIVASQLPNALGVAADGSLLGGAARALGAPGTWEMPSVLLSLVTIGVVLGGRRLHPLFPGVLVAAAIGVSYSHLAEYVGPSVGAVPSGMPPLSVVFPWDALPALIVPGIVIALVGFAEPAVIARMYAAQDRKSWSPDREFISQGVANLAAGVSAGFPVGGSFSRTAINRFAGGRTRWSGAITGLAVLAFLPIAGVLAPLPRAILGAMVIAAVVPLIALPEMVRLFRYSVPQALVGWTTFVCTIALAPRVDHAVLIGMAVAAIVHMWRERTVMVTAAFTDETLTLHARGVLFFASAPLLEQTMVSQLAEHPDARRVVVDLRGVGRLDYTGAVALRRLAEDARGAGLEVRITGLPDQARRVVTAVFGDGSPFLADEIAPPSGGNRGAGGALPVP